ncbi:MAG: FtsX-like permease family protein [Candidatus Magasanikbacteria bacterium]|nr:FtsX-like permease family protein [Candidatus Magasanikbacteria bacterium]
MPCVTSKIFMDYLYLHLAKKSLLRKKARTVLTILAISIGIAAVIVVFAAGYGLERLLNSQLEIFGTDYIEIEVKVPNVGKTSSENATGLAMGVTITTFKNDDLDAILEHENITDIYGAILGQEAVSYQDKLKKYFIMGAGSSAPEVDGTDIELGRFYTPEEESSLSQVAVLGFQTWQNLFDGEDPIGKFIKIKGKKYRIIGVMAERGSAFYFNLDEMIYIPLETMQKRVLGVDYLTFAVAKLKDPNLAGQTQEDLIYIMREQHDITDPNKDDFAVNTMDEAQEIFGQIIGSVTVLLVALVCISLIVGGVGIMNIMYVSVAERTFEIGLRKSVGAKKSDILWQFLTEAVLLTFGGGMAGVIFGAILAYAVKLVAESYNLEWAYNISILSIVVAVGFSIFVGILFGIYPAKKAAELDPIEALRQD